MSEHLLIWQKLHCLVPVFLSRRPHGSWLYMRKWRGMNAAAIVIVCERGMLQSNRSDKLQALMQDSAFTSSSSEHTSYKEQHQFLKCSIYIARFSRSLFGSYPKKMGHRSFDPSKCPTIWFWLLPFYYTGFNPRSGTHRYLSGLVGAEMQYPAKSGADVAQVVLPSKLGA